MARPPPRNGINNLQHSHKIKISRGAITIIPWIRLPNSNRNLSRRTQRKPIISADTNGHNYGNTFSDKGWISQILITKGAIKKIPLNDSNMLLHFIYPLGYPMGFKLLSG